MADVERHLETERLEMTSEIAILFTEVAEAIEHGYPLKAHARSVLAQYIRDESRCVVADANVQRFVHAMLVQGTQ